MLRLTWLIGLVLVLGACASHGGANPPDLSSVQFLRVRPDPNRVDLTARLEGTLVLEGDCLRVRASGGSMSIVWPPSAELTTERGRVAVRNGRSGRVYPVGERLVLGGGEIPSLEPVDLDSQDEAYCPPPYFLANFPE